MSVVALNLVDLWGEGYHIYIYIYVAGTFMYYMTLSSAYQADKYLIVIVHVV